MVAASLSKADASGIRLKHSQSLLRDSSVPCSPHPITSNLFCLAALDTFLESICCFSELPLGKETLNSADNRFNTITRGFDFFKLYQREIKNSLVPSSVIYTESFQDRLHICLPSTRMQHVPKHEPRCWHHLVGSKCNVVDSLS